MDGNYQVCFAEQAVGRVTVKKEGLYYRFCCRCTLAGAVVCRLVLMCENEPVHLGILVPIGESFGLDTRLPVKRVAGTKWDFQVMPARVVTDGRFIPIKPEEPFAYIARLKEAFLTRQCGQVGIMLKPDRITEGTV